MTEKDIAEYVIEWLKLQHWEVWQEVRFRRGSAIHDIVATRNKLMWVIEVKKALSLSVMAQARRSVAHFVSVAVLRGDKRHYNKGANFAEFVCKQHGIGVILVNSHHIQEYVEIKKREGGLGAYGRFERLLVKQHIAPALKRNGHNFIKADMEQLSEIPKSFSQAGSNGGGYWTPYKQTIGAVRDWLEKYPGSTPRKIIDGIKEHHYASDKSAYSNLATNLMTIEKKWCRFLRTKKGIKFYIRKGHDKESERRKKLCKHIN